MATTKSGKRRPSTSGGAPRSYSEMYKHSTAGVAPVQVNDTAARAPAADKQPRKPGPASQAAPLKTSDDVDWRGEYGYVLSDLRYLGLTTAGLLITIIVIGLFV